MNIFLSIIGVLVFALVATATWLKFEIQKNRRLNARLTAVKAELKGVLIRANTQNKVNNLTNEQVDLALAEYFRNE